MSDKTHKKESEGYNVYKVLEKDHRHVQGMFKEMLEGEERSDDLFSEIQSELNAHMTAEEKHFYPRLENEKKARNLVLEAYEEHQLAKELMSRLESSSDDDDVWMAKVKVLSDVIDHHIEEEEDMIFKEAKKILKKHEEEELAKQIEEEKLAVLGEEPAIEEVDDEEALEITGEDEEVEEDEEDEEEVDEEVDEDEEEHEKI